MEEQQVYNSTELFIFSREDNLDTIMDAFFECYGVPKHDAGNQLWLKNNKHSVNNVVFLPDMGEDYWPFIKGQRDSVCGHFAQVQNCDNDIRINFIHYLQQCKCFIDIKLESFEEDFDAQQESFRYVVNTLLGFLKKVDGILLVKGATAALNAEGKLILSDDGSTELDYYFPFEDVINPSFVAECTANQIQRRNENMKYLFDKHIFVIELPVNGDDEVIRIRSKEEIVKRTLGTVLISIYSECLLNTKLGMDMADAREYVYNAMKGYGLTDLAEVMSPKELAYFNDDHSDERTRIDHSWRYENVYLLEWALGLDEWTDVTDICNVSKAVRMLENMGTYEDICKAVTVRSKKEILDKADLVYRMDWACVDARIHRMPAPAGMDPSVVHARHKTLNWLICFEDSDWDDVDVPT